MVRHIPCGTFVNESERLACERLCAKLRGDSGDRIGLSNLNHAQHPSLRSDEIDAIRDRIHSSGRVLETRLTDGQRLKVNLDGAAAWEGQNANALLDDLFQPFHTPDFPRERIHIVAVNNGKLLEWIESQPEDTWLTGPLRSTVGVLAERVSTRSSTIRGISCNKRPRPEPTRAARTGRCAEDAPHATQALQGPSPGTGPHLSGYVSLA